MSVDLTKAKKPRLAMNIGTHNGTFHCDEVLACFLLKQLSHYADAEIIRWTIGPKQLYKQIFLAVET